MKYRSRISVVLLLFVATVCFAPALALENNGSGIAVLVVPSLAFAVTMALLAGIAYEINDRHLLVKTFGLNFMTVNIMEIRSVKRSYNPLSSPAGSLKRLIIKNPKMNLLISPVREKQFLVQLKAINPSIEIDVSDRNEWYRFWDWDI